MVFPGLQIAVFLTAWVLTDASASVKSNNKKDADLAYIEVPVVRENVQTQNWFGSVSSQLTRARRQLPIFPQPLPDDEDYYGSGDWLNATMDQWMACDGEMSRCHRGVGCAYFCDGFQECEDGSDETRDICSSMLSSTWKECGEGLYRCPFIEECAYLCDKNPDCLDNSDETEEACSFLNSTRCLGETRVVLNETFSLATTIQGSVDIIECPKTNMSERNYESYYGYWRCKWDSVWADMPDFSNCRNHQSFFPTSNSTLYAADNLTAVYFAIKDKFLLPGDILDIANELASLHEQHDIFDVLEAPNDAPTLIKRYISALLNVSSTLLDQHTSWHLMRKDKIRLLFSILQKSVVDAALIEARLLPSGIVRNYSATNLDLQIVSQDKDYFGERENRRYKPRNTRDTHILLPEEFYKNSEPPEKSVDPDYDLHFGEDNNRIIVVFNSFQNIHCLTNNVPCDPSIEGEPLGNVAHLVNSGVIGATIGFGNRWHANENQFVEIRFSHIYDGFTYKLANVRCKWWNTKIRYWSSNGCSLNYTNEMYSICHCNHLTNLAVIMDVRGLLKRNQGLWKALEWITLIGCSLSIICLALGIVCFALLKLARDKKKSTVGALKYFIRLNLCICLLLAELILLTGLNATKNRNTCIFVAALLHYFFTAVFTWCAIEAFNLYLALMKVFSTAVSQYHYVLTGYGIPLIMVAVTLGVTQTNGYGSDHACWLSPNGLIWSFAGTIALIMVANIVAFIMVMHVVWNEQTVGASAKPADKSKLRRAFGSISIFLVLGLTWITGFFYMTEASVALAVVFTLLNSLQGASIIIFGIFWDENIRKELLQIFIEKAERLRALVHNPVTSTAGTTVTTNAENDQTVNSASAANQIQT